jgi:hypothetical protein
MSPLRVECNGCHSVLQVRPELAGGYGRCPKCGAVVAIPSAGPPIPRPLESDRVESGWEGFEADESTIVEPTQPRPIPLSVPASSAGGSSMPLSQAAAPDMLAELRRRKKSAVLVVFDTPMDGSYALSRQRGANVRCYPTADMSDAQLMQVLDEVGRMSQGQRNAKGGVGLDPDSSVLPFELKGDRLGMTLADFKAKHARTIGGVKMPYTSESSAGHPNPTLWSEAWHAAAGIVHARVELPSENDSPTVAGVKTELFLYQFVDERLYRMMALFDTEAFHVVRAAIADKQGPPTSEVKDPMELAWDNGVSEIRLVRGMMRPKKASLLQYTHHELHSIADSRVPRRGDDL